MPRLWAILAIVVAGAFAVHAQFSAPGETVVVKGEIKPPEPNDCSGLVVHIRSGELTAFGASAVVGADCSFEIRNAPVGIVSVKVADRREQLIHETTARVARGGAPIEIQFSGHAGEAHPVSGVISVRQLAHKVPKQAMRLARKGSEADLRAAIAIDPDFTAAHAALGVMYAKRMRVEEALSAFERAKAAGMVSAPLEGNIAWALAAMRKPREAETAARRALAIDPTYARAHYMLGYVLMAASPDRRDDALRHLEAASPEMPAAAALIKRITAR